MHFFLLLDLIDLFFFLLFENWRGIGSFFLAFSIICKHKHFDFGECGFKLKTKIIQCFTNLMRAIFGVKKS